MQTRGIHHIWTTFNTWPPGDSRGHWSPLFDFYHHLIRDGHQLNIPDPITLQVADNLAKEPPKILTPAEMGIVSDVMSQLAPYTHRPARDLKPIPGLNIYAGAIEPTHVHQLIGPISIPNDQLVGMIKGQTSAAVIRASGGDRERTWTAGYWKVFLFDDDVVAAVKRYIQNHNLRRDMSARGYDWVIP